MGQGLQACGTQSRPNARLYAHRGRDAGPRYRSERGDLQPRQGRAPRAVAVPQRRSARPCRRDGPGHGSTRGVRGAGRTVFRVPRERPRPRGHRAVRHRCVHDTRRRARRPALPDPGHTVVLHDAGRTAPVWAAAHRQGRQSRRRHQPLALAVVVQLRSGGHRQELYLRRRNPIGDRDHEAGIPLPR
jgi:hypothetical protein